MPVCLVDKLEQRINQTDDALTGQIARLMTRIDGWTERHNLLVNSTDMRFLETEKRLKSLINSLALQVDVLEEWQEVVKQKAMLPLPGVGQMLEQYDAEHDAAPVSYWDMKLLGMIEKVNERICAWEVHDGTSTDA